MELGSRRRLLLSIGLLVVIQLLVSLSAIILLERMIPAIERILVENVGSLQALEEMALALAEPEGGEDRHARFDAALARAKANVTVPGEAPAVLELERTAEAALAGEPAARRTAIAELRRLGDANREAMERADREASRLGTAGAWAAVFLALTGLLASVLTIRRLETRLLDPIAELGRVVAAQRAGDRHRRCRVGDAEGELAVVVQTVNELFDLRERTGESEVAPADSDERALVLHLLDARQEPVLVAGPRGEVLAANKKALDLLADGQAANLRAKIATAIKSDGSQGPLPAERIGETEQWLCTLSPEIPQGPSGGEEVRA
jgi:hypothetical protein